MAESKPVPTLLDLFIERAEALSAQVSSARTTSELASVIARSAAGSSRGGLAASQAVLAEYPTLAATLQGLGVTVQVAEDLASGLSRSEAAAALAGEVGVVSARAGVAETGAFLSADETLPSRLLGMLSDILIAVLRADAIVPTLDEMATLLSSLPGRGIQYASLVAGPSRTADIERVLTIGVQGPRELHIIVVLDR